MEGPEEMESAGEKRVYQDSERTPGWLRTYVGEDFNVTFEPEDSLMNPLADDWQGFSFAHPPHAEAQLWCDKAAKEAEKGHHSVLLLPAVFNSVYWREIVYRHATEVRVFTCPVKMPHAKKQIVSQMCLVVFAGTAGRDPAYPYPPVFPVEPTNWRENYYKRQRNMLRFGNH